MRYLASLALSVALLTHPAAAQNVTIRLDFETGEGTAGASALATLPIKRGWVDSVSSYFNDELRQKGPTNLVRTQAAIPNYRLLIQPLPMMTTDDKPVGVMVYSLTLLRPPYVGTNWVYLNSTVGYGRNPMSVATGIVNFVNTELRR